MTTSRSSHSPTVAELHVFEQAGGWHWGITVPRAKGSGFKLIAYSERTFAVEDAARTDGTQVLASLADRGEYDRVDVAATCSESPMASRALPRQEASG